MSGTVDPNIARSFNPSQHSGPFANPLQAFGQVVGIANAVNQNRRENEMFNAQQQIGRTLQGSLNPETGTIDYERFSAGIRDNPLAAFLAPQALAQARQLEQGALQVQAAQAQLGVTRLNNLRTTLGGLLANPNVTRRDVVAAVGQLLALPESERPFSATVAASQLAQLPDNPEAIRQWLMTHLASTQAGLSHLQQFLPQGIQVPAGGTVRSVNRDPLTGTVTPAPGDASEIPLTPTPAERDAPTPFFDPSTNTPRMAPRQDVLPMYDGQGRPVNRPPQSPFGTGRFTPPGAAAAPPAQGPQPNVATGPALGEAGAQEVAGRQAAEGAARLATQAAEIPNLRTILANLDQLVGGFSPGPGAQWQRVAAAGWNRLAPNTFQFDPQAIANQEEFAKQAFALASQQFQMLGGSGSNDQLAQVIGTSPSELLSRQGNRGIIAMLRGNTDALDVMNREWQAAVARGTSPSQFNQFLAEFNRSFDPRVFQWVYLGREARETMWRNMNQRDRDSLTRAANEAVQRGWVSFPTPQAPAARQSR